MSYTVILHKPYLKALKGISDDLKANINHTFNGIQTIGLTGIDPAILYFGNNNTFSIEVLDNAFREPESPFYYLKGFINDPFDGVLHIVSMDQVSPESCLQENLSTFVDDIPHYNRDTSDTITIQPCLEVKQFAHKDTFDFNDIAQKIGQSFFNMYFYRDIEHLKQMAKYSHTLKSKRPYLLRKLIPGLSHWQFETSTKLNLWKQKENKGKLEYSTRDAFLLKSNHLPNITELIRESAQLRNTLTFVNYIDELCPFSMAQLEYTHLMARCLPIRFPGLNIRVIDIVARDIQRAEPYMEAYHFARRYRRFKCHGVYQSKKLNPYTMVMGKFAQYQSQPQQQDIEALWGRRGHIMDFDLFPGCRHEDKSWKLYHQYRHNLCSTNKALLDIAGRIRGESISTQQLSIQ